MVAASTVTCAKDYTINTPWVVTCDQWFDRMPGMFSLAPFCDTKGEFLPQYTRFFRQTFPDMKEEHLNDLCVVGIKEGDTIVSAAAVQFIGVYPKPSIACYCIVYFLHTQKEY